MTTYFKFPDPRALTWRAATSGTWSTTSTASRTSPLTAPRPFLRSVLHHYPVPDRKKKHVLMSIWVRNLFFFLLKTTNVLQFRLENRRINSWLYAFLTPVCGPGSSWTCVKTPRRGRSGGGSTWTPSTRPLSQTLPGSLFPTIGKCATPRN